MVLAGARSQPVVLAFEDLHWADPTTLELAGLLVQEVRSARALDGPPCRLCVVFTARPEFEPPWPIEDMAIMQLARLDREQVEEMITAGLAHGRALPCCIAPFSLRGYDSFTLGDATQETLREIWNGDRYQAFRAGLLSDRPPAACTGCGLRWSL